MQKSTNFTQKSQTLREHRKVVETRWNIFKANILQKCWLLERCKNMYYSTLVIVFSNSVICFQRMHVNLIHLKTAEEWVFGCKNRRWYSRERASQILRMPTCIADPRSWTPPRKPQRASSSSMLWTHPSSQESTETWERNDPNETFSLKNVKNKIRASFLFFTRVSSSLHVF